MIILSPEGEKDSVGAVPPAALGVILNADPRTRHLLNEKDRFGFPLHATLLEKYDLLPELELLARDAVGTLSRLLGPDKARHALLAAFRQAKEGKSDNLKENEARLAAYDNEIAAGIDKRHAARRAAEKMSEGRNADVESIARHIRDLAERSP